MDEASTTEASEIIDTMDFLNKDAFLASWGCFLAAGAFTNISVIGAIIFLYTCAEDSNKARNTPRFLPMLIGCAAHVLFLVGPSVVSLHRNRFEETRTGSYWTCKNYVAIFVAYYFFTSLSMLCVAVTVLTEVMRVQKWVTLTWKAKMTLTWICLVVSLLYSLVVVLTVFYEVYLSESHKPCWVKNGVVVGIQPSAKQGDRRAQMVVSHIVPYLVIFLAIVLLLFAYLTSRASRHSENHPRGRVYANSTQTAQGTADCRVSPTTQAANEGCSTSGDSASAPLPTGSNPGNDKSVSMYVNAVPTTTTSQGSDAVSNDKLVSMYVNTMPTTTTSQGPRHANSRGHAIAQDALGYSEDLPAVLVRKAAHDPSSEMSNWPADNRWISEIEEEGEEEGEEEDERVSRPLLISLAGVVVVFCDLITYVYFEVFLLDEGRLLDWEEYRSGLKWKVKLWASATILQIVGMTLVSVCWLLDHVIRPLIPKYFRNMDCSNISTSSAP